MVRPALVIPACLLEEWEADGQQPVQAWLKHRGLQARLLRDETLALLVPSWVADEPTPADGGRAFVTWLSDVMLIDARLSTAHPAAHRAPEGDAGRPLRFSDGYKDPHDGSYYGVVEDHLDTSSPIMSEHPLHYRSPREVAPEQRRRRRRVQTAKPLTTHSVPSA